MKNIPLNEQDSVIEALAYAYPTWFFEVLTELEDGKPFVLEDFQINILLDFESRLSITNKCRQAGGSLIFAAEEFFKAYTQRNYRCDIVSKTLSGSADNVAYIKRLYDSLPMRHKSPLSVDNVLSIGFHQRNPSLIKSFAPTTSVRGGRKSILFDEYAHWTLQGQELIYNAALPAILNGALSLRIISTPLGDMNKFADIFLNRRNDKGQQPYRFFKRHQFIWLDVRRFVRGYDIIHPYNSDEGPFKEVQNLWYNVYKQDMSKMEELVVNYGSETLQLMLASLAWEDFLTEMCGSFINFQNQFFNWDVINKAAKGRLGAADLETEDAFTPWEKRPANNSNEVIIGIDFGESTPKSDKTVVQVVEHDRAMAGRTGEYIHRHSRVLNDAMYDQGGYTAQCETIISCIRKFRPDRIVADATTLGGPIIEMLEKKLPNQRIERVVFNNDNKEDMIINLRVMLETDKLWIQDEDKMLHRELGGMRKSLTTTGLIRYSGEPHDDRVWALALAVKGRTYSYNEFYMLG